MLPIRSLPRSLPLRQGAFVCRQCQRQQTRAASTTPPPAAGQTSSDPRSQILMQQLQDTGRAVPSYPQAKAKDTRTKSSQTAYDGPFHPAIMGLAAGFMMAAGGMYLQYHFSGRARIVNHFTEVHNRISDDRLRLFVAPGRKTLGAVEGTIDERIQWFERCARYYAAYVPGADVYVDITLPDIEAARRAGGPEMDAKIDTIVRETAQELQNLIKGGEMGLAVGTSAWKIMHTKMELVAESVDQQRGLPTGVRERVQKKIEGLVKTGTRIGRSERRAMEDEELKKGVA